MRGIRLCMQRLMEMRNFFKEKQLIKRINNLEKSNEGSLPIGHGHQDSNTDRLHCREHRERAFTCRVTWRSLEIVPSA